MKIFGFIGSPLRERSNTYTVTKMMLDELVKIDVNVNYELLTAGHVRINHCEGCWSCMIKGKCPQDKLDDMGLLKQKMIDSDLIIWGSPVYTLHVSGQMKTFLDRLSSWYHLLKLAGKMGMTSATTAGMGLKEVNDYLGLMQSAIGLKRVGVLGTYGSFPNTLTDPKEAREEAIKSAENILPYLKGEKQLETDESLEESFQVMKNKVIYGAKWLPYENKYWYEHGMLDLNTFEELLDKIRNKSKE